MSWFKRTPPEKTPVPRVLPNAPVAYPSGIAVHSENGYFFMNKDGKRYRITSTPILLSWNFPLIVETTEVALTHYPVAVGKLGFRDGSLLHNIADGKLYLVSESKLRHITDPAVLTRLGKTAADAMLVSQADINIMKLGAPIT